MSVALNEMRSILTAKGSDLTDDDVSIIEDMFGQLDLDEMTDAMPSIRRTIGQVAIHPDSKLKLDGRT